ncbi:hypothetical protein BN2497_5717 [Janthinobacterium sp. CG23_2]|nr:hypothetical protein BN2497_5717 [Janthinobacterium sp. CG23_2]CUU29256.1 hypothetical protein BN3177_5717 [Janthinobacterium sp. CG23_2]
MLNYVIPFSGQRNFPSSADNSWLFEVEFSGRHVEIEINLVSGELAKGLAQARQIFPDLHLLDQKAREAIRHEFSREPSNSRYFVTYFEERYSSEEISEIFDTDSVIGVEELLAAIELKVVSFHFGQNNEIAVLDYQLGEIESDQILAVYFNRNGESVAVTMES